MREVFVHQDHARVGLYQTVLEEAGIPSFIRNQFSNNSVDGFQGASIFPALTVYHDADYDEAIRILGKIYYDDPAPPPPDWDCPQCQEQVPGTFESCWKCGTLRPGLAPLPEE